MTAKKTLRHTERLAFLLTAALSLVNSVNAQEVAPIVAGPKPKLFTKDAPMGKVPLLASRRQATRVA